MKLIKIYELSKVNNNKNVCIAGLVIIRQKPVTANGVTFLTLEDETGTVNIICWKNVYIKYKTEILSAKLLRINGKLQRQNNVTNIIAYSIENLSKLLDLLPHLNIRTDHIKN